MEGLTEQREVLFACLEWKREMEFQQQQYLHQIQLECELSMYNDPIELVTNASVCPRVFDGIMCWPPTPAGTTHFAYCPDYFMGFNTSELASRQCLEDGTWFWNYEENRTWTNYSLCGAFFTPSCGYDTQQNSSLIVEILPVIKQMSQIGYGVSLVTLVVAISILATFRRLRCPRNTLHIHLFLSFIMRAFMSLIKDNLFLNGLDASPANITADCPNSTMVFEPTVSWECKLVTSLWQYFIMANYSWILMEGLYLHNLIFLALFTDSSAITMYIILGWGIPAFFVGLWVVCRLLFENVLCWTTNFNPYVFWIIRGPITLSVVVNFIFFLHIAWVLLLKLRSSVSAETRKYRYRKWGKSTLVLMPLFGVHYTALLWMSGAIGKHETVEVVWLFCDQFFASFQGFFVAVLYCLVNGEVRTELKKKWSSLEERCFATRSRSDSKTIWSRLTLSTRNGNGRASSQSVHTMTIIERKDGSLSPSPYFSRQTGSTNLIATPLPIKEESIHSSSNDDKMSPVTCTLEPVAAVVNFQVSEYVPAFKTNHCKQIPPQSSPRKYGEPASPEEVDRLLPVNQ